MPWRGDPLCLSPSEFNDLARKMFAALAMQPTAVTRDMLVDRDTHAEWRDLNGAAETPSAAAEPKSET